MAGPALAALLRVGTASAQVIDSLPRRADTAAARDSADAFQRQQADILVRVPVMPRLAADGPRPAASRVVFTRDSIDWAGAATVGDLLGRVPGVYLWRGGGIGRPELPNFAGRGGASIEYLLDGVPYLPLGPDSVSVDPALLPLGLVERIEVERWPGQLRVSLHSRRHDRLAARSHILLGAGPRSLTMYQGAIERRFLSGFGFGGGAEYLKSPASTGQYQNTQIWGYTSFVRSERFGLELQYLGATPDRDAFSEAGELGERHEGRRSDILARAFFGRGGGRAPRVDVVAGRSAFDSAGIDQSVTQLGAALSLRSATWAVRAGAFRQSRWTSLDGNAALSWTPASLLTVAGEGAYRRHDGDRTSRWLGLRAGLSLPAGLSLSASARRGQLVAAPAVATSAEQTLSEADGLVSWDLRRVSAFVGYSRTKSFAPPAFQPYSSISVIAPSGRTNWLTIGGRVAPVSWFSVHGWVSDPRSGAPDGLPPKHYMASATIRSKFLRRFPSGAFDLKLELGVEGWDSGVLGRSADGAPVSVPSATFVRGMAQLQLQSFSLFIESRNMAGRAAGYVPGFRIPRYTGFFGVRWGFNN